MLSERRVLIAEIEKQLGNRNLFWFGTRGDDAISLGEIQNFSGSFTYLNEYQRAGFVASASYENIAKRRVDLDRWDIDDFLFEENVAKFRSILLNAMGNRNAIVPYRPTNFLSALLFARMDTSLSLGLFAPHQRVFEHKPWVETAVTSLNIPTLNPKYIADENQLDNSDLLKDGPIVLRPSRGSGGTGITKVDTVEKLLNAWPKTDEFFATVSKYYSACLSINVGAVVWDDDITIHYPSAQLIGIPYLVARPFGYCGNDFALIKSLDESVIDQIEESTKKIGNWLRAQGYLGAYGVDYMLDKDTLRFTEINPRFQGSTRVSSYISAVNDLPCILLDHIAAFLHLRPNKKTKLSDLVKEMPDIAHVVMHNISGRRKKYNVSDILGKIEKVEDNFRSDVRAISDIPVDNEAIISSLTFYRQVSDDGFSLQDDLCKGFDR